MPQNEAQKDQKRRQIKRFKKYHWKCKWREQRK